MLSNLDLRRRDLLTMQDPFALPDEYRQVEWIGCSSEGPYIQTNIKLTNGPARLHLRFSCSDGGEWGRDFFGVRKGAQAGQQGLLIKVNKTRSNFFVSAGNITGAASARILDTALPFNADSVVEVDAALSAGNSAAGTITAAFTVNGIRETVVSTGVTGENTQTEISILGSIVSGTRAVGKIFGAASAWNDGRLVLCAVPCYRKADGAIGVYDTVHGVFYTNAGTGEFTKGADV